jgi:hypothetical protein
MFKSLSDYFHTVFIGGLILVVICPVLWLLTKRKVLIKNNEAGRINLLEFYKKLILFSTVYLILYCFVKYVIL